jgi:ABC-type sugar transport system substrate-binding protein
VKITWQSTILAAALLVFILLVLFLGMHYGSSFSTVWAALGSVVGVLTGAIPSYFFKQQADSANAQATKQAQQTTVYAEQLSPQAVQAVHEQLAERNLL